MDRHPTHLDILAAERRLEASRREIHERVSRLRASVRARLAQPTTLVCIAGAGVLLGIGFARRHRRRVRAEAGAAAPAAAGGLLAALVARYGWPQLSRWAMTAWSSRHLWMPARSTAAASSAANAAAHHNVPPPL